VIGNIAKAYQVIAFMP